MNIDFLLDLANVLEKHKVTIVSPNGPKEPFVPVAFRTTGNNNDMYPTLIRNHISAYDLRTTSGMSSKEANEMYQINKRIKENNNV